MLQEIKAAATADGKIDGEYQWEFAHASLEIQLARTRKYLSNGSRTGILFVKDHNRDREAEDEQLPIDSPRPHLGRSEITGIIINPARLAKVLVYQGLLTN